MNSRTLAPQEGNYYGDMQSQYPPQTQAFPSACPHNNHVPINARVAPSGWLLPDFESCFMAKSRVKVSL